MLLNSSSWILDAGGTKVSCAFLGSKNQEYIYPQGIVPYMLDDEELFRRLQSCYLAFAEQKIDKIYYYGSGCNLEKNQFRIKRVLQQLVPNAEIQVMHDVLGAARAVCGTNNGIASIMGTGSSACWYDGTKIKIMRAGLGYILGDEGSGVDLGRRLLRAILYEQLEPKLRTSFYQQTKLDEDTLINKIYNSQGANKFLASFNNFIYQNLDHKQIKSIVYESLSSFVTIHLLPLANLSSCRHMYFIGGIAYCYKDILADILAQNNLQLKNIIHQPIKGLLEYHQ